MPLPDAPAEARGADVVGRHRRLVRRTALVSGLTLASRLLGYARESLAAAIFGDRSPINDAFVTAWRIPNLFRSLMGEGAIATAMQTALTKADAEGGEERGRRLFLAILRTVACFALCFCILGIAVALYLPDVMPVTGWRWLGADPAPVRELTARMLPFVILACTAAVIGGALHVRGHFLSPSLGPVVMNVAWVGSLVWVAARHGADLVSGAPSVEVQLAIARDLALCVLGSGLLLVAVQLPALRTRGLGAARPGAPPSEPVGSAQVLRILRESAPLALGAAVYQVNVLIDSFMAESLLPNGGPSALYYASRVQQLPLSLVSVAATSAVFPALTALGHVRDLPGLRQLHDQTQRAVAFLAIPATLGLLVFAEPIVALCFQHGNFGADGVTRTSAALRGLTLAILPVGAAGLVARTRYALGDFAGPARIAAGVLVLNTGLSLVLVLGFGLDADGLTLATAVSSAVNLALLWPGLRRHGLPASDAGLWVGLARIGLAAGLACGIGWLAARPLAGSGREELSLVVAIPCAALAYAGIALLLGIPEARRALAALRRLAT